MEKKMEAKYFTSPDEVRKFEKGEVELVNIRGTMIGKATFEPGWKWSSHVKPLAKTKLCEVPHFQYLISGTIHVVMADGTEVDLKPGSVALIPPGHDA
ncbi:MAG: cupin domain-containing protein, partial [bacterium]|nr:cupin domain-containing protein [bacterium]